MGITENKLKRAAAELKKADILAKLREAQNSIPEDLPSVPRQYDYSAEALQQRIDFIQQHTGKSLPVVTGKETITQFDQLKGNIENFFGFAQVPIGIAGPIRIKGSEASGDYFIPLATSEGALVASYGRGMKACRNSGEIISVCLQEGVQRSPLFRFDTMLDMGVFAMYVLERADDLQTIVAQVSRYAQLHDLKINIEGNSVIVIFEYVTGDAAGQNMVTLCTNKICEYLVENSPVKPTAWFVEGNYSGDKKATALSFSNVRGKKVSAEIVLNRDVIQKTLKTSAQSMALYWQSSTLAVIQSGSIGAQGHVANGLAALFIACGQDAACVAEASVGLTRMEVTNEEDLYVSVTLPSLIVGTVGGGTHLPTQKECLDLIDCLGVGKARKFAEICAAVALSGEVSIAAALSAGHFAKAHETLGRKHKK